MLKSKHYNNTISLEDRELFRSAVDNSTILDKDKLQPHSHHRTTHPKFLNYRLIHHAEFTASDYLNYNQGTSAKNFKQMQQGRVSIAASIDLHGCTTEEACIALADFIYHQQKQQYLHIVHGKGYNSSTLSKLKTQTFIYLCDHPQVIALCSAPPHLGGTGAVIVKLKYV